MKYTYTTTLFILLYSIGALFQLYAFNNYPYQGTYTTGGQGSYYNENRSHLPPAWRDPFYMDNHHRAARHESDEYVSSEQEYEILEYSHRDPAYQNFNTQDQQTTPRAVDLLTGRSVPLCGECYYFTENGSKVTIAHGVPFVSRPGEPTPPPGPEGPKKGLENSSTLSASDTPFFEWYTTERLTLREKAAADIEHHGSLITIERHDLSRASQGALYMLGIEKAIFVECTGNQLQQALQSDCVFIINQFTEWRFLENG